MEVEIQPIQMDMCMVNSSAKTHHDFSARAIPAGRERHLEEDDLHAMIFLDEGILFRFEGSGFRLFHNSWTINIFGGACAIFTLTL